MSTPQYGSKPPEAALSFLREKGWQTGFDWRDVWRTEHVAAFTVAKAMEAEVLETLRGAVDRALAEGRTFEQFRKELTPELERLGWWGKKEMVDPLTGETRVAQLGSPRRLKTIYSMNLRMAHAAGQWELIEQTKKALPFLQYRLGPSKTHRDTHASFDGLILPADDPFWETHFPPNGWGCKCWTKQLTTRQAEAAGGPSRRPNIEPQPWVNPRTGERMLVPRGVSPGFDYNPGKERLSRLQTHLKDTLNRASSATAAQAVHRAWMRPEVFAQWRENPQGNLPVAVMDPDTQQLMGAKRRTVLLSDWTMKKQDGRKPIMRDGKPSTSEGHPELTNEEYGLLPAVVEKGQIIQLGAERMAYFYHEGRLYEAIVKATSLGELFIESFHRAKKDQPERELRKPGATELRKEKRGGAQGLP